MSEAATRDEDVDVGGIAADRLRSIIERVERLEEERKALASDIKDIFAEAKSAGFDNQQLGGHLVEKVAIVAHEDDRAVEFAKRLFERVPRPQVKMVGWFIENEHVRITRA